MRHRPTLLACLSGLTALLAMAPAALAQSSASFVIGEAVLNAGGHPSQGVVLTSPGFTLTLGSLGETPGGGDAAGSTLRLAGGFVGALRPSGETLNLRFTSAIDLAWEPEPAAVGHRVYRGSVGTLLGSIGACIATAPPGSAVADPAQPAAGAAWTYLVTSLNRLNEEGPAGYRSDGAARPPGTPCP